MKISCSVEISNRITRTKGRGSNVATLALCHKNKKSADQQNDKDVFLIVCTHKNPTGRKYKIYNNVETLFTKFMNEGKATVRFKLPEDDVIISKADPLQLKGFIHGVGLTIIGQGKGRIKLSPKPTKVDRPKNKLLILHRKDYPLSTGFQTGLTWLQVSNCSLKKIDNRILKLKNLQVLDLSSNKIKLLPKELGQLRIRELILNNNEIVEYPDDLSLGAINQTLQILDLSYNKISKLSPYFCLMKNVRVLSLKCNNISALPRNIQCMESLRMFSASSNHIKVLPFGIRKLALDTLDLFQNPLNTNVVLHPLVPWEVPSLMEWSALSIVQNKVSYTAEDLPPNLNYFLAARCPCPCGRLVFQCQSSCILVLDLHKLASTVVYVNNTSRFKVPLEVFFCSTKCWKKARGFPKKHQ